MSRQPKIEVGSELKISALVKLGKLSPDDVAVEIYYGSVDAWGNIINGAPSRMTYDKAGTAGRRTFLYRIDSVQGIRPAWFCGEDPAEKRRPG